MEAACRVVMKSAGLRRTKELAAFHAQAIRRRALRSTLPNPVPKSSARTHRPSAGATRRALRHRRAGIPRRGQLGGLPERTYGSRFTPTAMNRQLGRRVPALQDSSLFTPTAVNRRGQLGRRVLAAAGARAADAVVLCRHLRRPGRAADVGRLHLAAPEGRAGKRSLLGSKLG